VGGLEVSILHVASQAATIHEEAKRLRASLRPKTCREHESGHVAGGIYYILTFDNSKLTLALEDDVSFGEYQFELQFLAAQLADANSAESEKQQVLQKLVQTHSHVSEVVERRHDSLLVRHYRIDENGDLVAAISSVELLR
jgi:predicted regulator of Ras-like GTPase activity (Roadblock/LC7/MglB family)